MNRRISEWMHDGWQDDEGVTAIEYGLLAALIVVTCIVAFGAAGTSLTEVYDYWSRAVVAALGG